MVYYTTVTVIKSFLKKFLIDTEQLIVLFSFFFFFFFHISFSLSLFCFRYNQFLLSLLLIFFSFICLCQTCDELVMSDQITICMFTCIAIRKKERQKPWWNRGRWCTFIYVSYSSTILFLRLFIIEMCRVCFLSFW